MALIDIKRFESGFWLGLLAVLFFVIAWEAIRIIPASGNFQVLSLKAALIDQQKDRSTEDNISSPQKNFGELQPAKVKVGQGLTNQHDSRWQWVMDPNNNFEIRMPEDWLAEYSGSDSMSLKKGLAPGGVVEINILDGSQHDLTQSLLDQAGALPVSVAFGRASGQEADNALFRVVGFYDHHKIAIFKANSGIEQDIFKAILSSFEWQARPLF